MTQKEIVERIEQIKESDFFGFQTGDLIACLDFEHAKPYLRPEVTADQWSPVPSDRESVIARMKEYMPFACTAWVWLAGDEGKFGDLEDYEYYSKDNLAIICELYGWDASQWDDGHRSNSSD